MPDDAVSLQTFLADRDVACPGCGYNLRGLVHQTCPECSQELRLAVGLVEPRLGLWLTAVIGAALGLGLNFLLLVYLAIAVGAAGRGGSFMVPFLTHNACGLFIQGGLLFFILKRGRNIRRWRPWLRATLAAFAWLLSLINVLVFSMLVK